MNLLKRKHHQQSTTHYPSFTLDVFGTVSLNINITRAARMPASRKEERSFFFILHERPSSASYLTKADDVKYSRHDMSIY